MPCPGRELWGAEPRMVVLSFNEWSLYWFLCYFYVSTLALTRGALFSDWAGLWEWWECEGKMWSTRKEICVNVFIAASQSVRMCFASHLCLWVCVHREWLDVCDISMYCHLRRLTLTVHINRVVVEMGSSLLLHFTHAIIPLASQCAIAVIRWKQTLLLADCVCLRESEYSGVNFNIYCTWAPVSPADNALSQTLLSAFPLPAWLSLIFPQNQAEAHYKGHKHARKLKAMEAQKNRQRRAGEASSTGRERDRDRDRERDRDRSKTTTSEAALPVLMDTSLVEGTST